MDPALGKLRWRCRRGTRELDELLTRYLDEQYPAAAAAQQEAFRELLESQDGVIQAYLLGAAEPPNAALARLIERITSRPANHRY